jgi:hypothetical protein
LGRLNVAARVDAPGAWVEARGSFLRTNEISHFANEADQLHATLQGTATLDCMEPELRVSLEAMGHGQIAMTIDLTGDNTGQSHQFRSTINQSYLPALIASCEAIFRDYPVRGSPEN